MTIALIVVDGSENAMLPSMRYWIQVSYMCIYFMCENQFK